MSRTALAQNRLVAVWIERKLTDRSAIEWAVKAISRSNGDRAELISLLSHAAESAASEADVPADIKRLWRLLHHVAREQSTARRWFEFESIRRIIKDGTFDGEHVRELIDFVRPRLKAELPRMYGDDGGLEADRRDWVFWDFEASTGAFTRNFASIGTQTLELLSAELLETTLTVGSEALEAALALAREVGWISDHRDRANRLVGRVAAPLAQPDEVSEEETDPDRYRDEFVPLIRLLSTAFDTLARKDAGRAALIVNLWKLRTGSLFKRLVAYASCNALVVPGASAARWLMTLDDLAFWRSTPFPEIAALRALRWPDFPATQREPLVERLWSGPPAATWHSREPVETSVLMLVRDQELARIVDHVRDAPPEFVAAVSARRSTDERFPRVVPIYDEGSIRFRWSSVPEGDPSTFDDVPQEQLVDALLSYSHRIDEGDAATAFVRSNRSRVVEALATTRLDEEQAVKAWDLLLSYPHETNDDADEERAVAERIAQLATALPERLFGQVADRLSYWLDATEEKFPRFAGAIALWLKLVPVVASQANEGDLPSDTSDPEAGVGMLDALNVPLGRLISMFLRHCGKVGGATKLPPVPPDMAAALKQLVGTAEAILAQRVVTNLNYWSLADYAWLEKLVLNPLTLSNDLPTVRGLWETLSRYGQMPSPKLWAILERHALDRLLPSVLSREGQRRLAEMAVVAWVRSKYRPSVNKSDVSTFRSRLLAASDAVRAAVASTYVSNLEAEDRRDAWARIGRSFFEELWPREPTIQTPETAGSLAEIPAKVAAEDYVDAVRTVLPYIRPFDVWSVEYSLGLDENARPRAAEHPNETLEWVAACVREDWGTVDGLGELLEFLSHADPNVDRNPRFRRLLRYARR